MDFSRFLDGIVSFAQSHTIITIVFALGLLSFLYRAPKLFFALLFVGLFLVGLFYMISSMDGLGSEQKKRLIPTEEKQSDSISRPGKRGRDALQIENLASKQHSNK